LYYDEGLMDAAMEHLRQASAIVPEDPRPHRLMGLILRDFGKDSDAVEAYRESLRRDAHQHDKDDILLELGGALYRLRQSTAALEVLAMSVSTADTLALQAECHYSLGRADEAEHCVARALELDPSHLKALSLEGTLLLDNQDAAAAVRTLERACAAHPKDYSAAYKLARAYQAVGDEHKAAAQTRLAKALEQSLVRFKELHKRAMREPRDSELRYEIGLLAAELDRPLLARTWFQAALALDPRHAAARAALGRLDRSLSSASPQRTVDSP
jgi:tetratricopeptide (TPR) repeat protein